MCNITQSIYPPSHGVKHFMNDSKIGERIRKARQDKRLSQGQLGEKTGLSTMGISYLESGQRKAKIEDLNKIADALGVSLSYILEPIAATQISYPGKTFPSTTFGRISDELSEEQKHEVD